MHSQPIDLTRELILYVQITRRRVDANGDSALKSPRWYRVSNLRPSDPDLLQFAAVPSMRERWRLFKLITFIIKAKCHWGEITIVENT